MNTLIVTKKHCEDYYDIEAIFCPFCKKQGDAYNLEVDDYVGCNCLFWCDECGEILLCPTGYNSTSKINDIICDKVENCDCTKKLEGEELKTYCNKKQFDLDYDSRNYRFYKVSILNVTQIKSSSEDGSSGEEDQKSGKIKYHDVNIYRFSDTPKGISTDHDGIHLYYKAHCDNCGEKYESYIWGD